MMALPLTATRTLGGLQTTAAGVGTTMTVVPPAGDGEIEGDGDGVGARLWRLHSKTYVSGARRLNSAAAPVHVVVLPLNEQAPPD